jgi:hypothetical protein
VSLQTRDVFISSARANERQLFGCSLYCQVSIYSSDRTRHARQTSPGKLAELTVTDAAQSGLDRTSNPVPTLSR